MLILLRRAKLLVLFVLVFCLTLSYVMFFTSLELGSSSRFFVKKRSEIQQKGETMHYRGEVSSLKNRSVQHPSSLDSLPGWHRSNASTTKTLPLIFFITPTYTRTTQKVDLTRLCQTLRLVPNLLWILVEDSPAYTPIPTSILDRCPVASIHLFIATTTFVPREEGGEGHRGVEQRNIALQWIREHFKEGDVEGVVYFGDDDNGYDTRLFEEMRYTQKVSVWPVAFVGGLKYESPICKNGSVVGWHTGFRPDRQFPIDMAGFAIDVSIILDHPNTFIDHTSKSGMLETDFLAALKVTISDFKCKANDCKEVYVWHTKTNDPSLYREKEYPGDKLVQI